MLEKAEKQIELNSVVSSATIYQHQARVTRKIKASLDQGVQRIIVTGLPNQLHTNTIQVQGTGKLTILGIRHEVRDVERENFNEELEAIAVKIEKVDEKLAVLKDEFYLIEQEESFLQANRQITGKSGAVSLEQIKDLSEFMRQGFEKAVNGRQEATRKKKKLEKDKKLLTDELKELLAYHSENNLRVIIEVDVSESSEADLTLNYLIGACGWHATYDVRVDSESEELKVSYKAKIYKMHSEKWNDVRIRLSSGNPSLNNTKPVLNRWYLVEEVPVPAVPENLKFSMQRIHKKASLEAGSQADTSVENVMETNETAINVYYEIDALYTIADNNESVSIGLKEYAPAADFRYSAVPKLDSCGFLTAAITDWDYGALLSGTMHIYLDETYVGETFFDTKSTKDELLMSLGRDERIVVSREQRKHKKSNASLIGNKKKESFNYLTKIRNNTSKDVTLTLEDHIPVSKLQEVQVKPSKEVANLLEEETGIVKCELDVASGAVATFELEYVVFYPKDDPPHGL